MISVDTNVLVRAFLHDHPEQAKEAEFFLKNAAHKEELFISSYALLEMVWVLKVQKYSPPEICEALLDLLDSPGIVIGQRAVVSRAVEMSSRGKADFGDYMILAEGLENGCSTVATFDQKFRQDTSAAKRPKDTYSK